ncbi:MAG: DUF2752 domain-containing protein [Planctomycetaceae bacterium]|nr:MAG: DUF2752 domain-containing protein [Planctomycetaceae bacterium]
MSDTIYWPYEARSAVAGENPHANQREYHLIMLLMCTAVLAASFILQPHDEGLSILGFRWPFHCWLHETLGVQCALCGMSRSFCSLAHGDLGASLGFHRLGLFLFAFFCLQIPYRLYALAVQPGAIDRRVVKAHCGLAALLCAAIACNWFLYLEGLIV